MSEAVNAIIDVAAKAPLEVPAVETKGPVASQEPKEERVSGRLEMLIRREQQALARERIAKAAESESTRLRAELDTERARITEFNSLKSNPKLALEKLGLTYDELTKAMLTDGEIPAEVEIKKLRGDLDGLKQSREDERRLLAEQAKSQAQAQEQQTITDFQSEINTYVLDNAARYELINFDSRQGEVYELIDAHYTRTQLAHAKELEAKGEDTSQAIGKVMKIAEAADKIEEYYEKREEEKKKLSKLQVLWGSVPKTTLMKEVEKQIDRPKPPQRTLTNNLSAQSLKPKVRPVNEDERVAKIVADWRAARGG